MNKAFLMLASMVFLFGCGGSVGIGAGPVEVGVSFDSQGRVSVYGNLQKRVSLRLGFVGLTVALEKTLSEIPKTQKQYFLYILWEDSNGEIYREEYEVGKPFIVNFDATQRVRQIRGDNNSIVVVMERVSSPPTATRSVFVPPADTPRPPPTRPVFVPPTDTSRPPATRIVPVASYYMLVAKHSGKCLSVQGASYGNGVNIAQEDCGGGDNQLWIIGPLGSGYRQIVAKHSGKCLSVKNASREAGEHVIQSECSGASHNLWTLDSRGGYYLIMNQNSGYCVDVPQFERGVAHLVQWHCAGTDNQLWQQR